MSSFHFTSTPELMLFQVFMVMVNHQSLKVPWNHRKHSKYSQDLEKLFQWHLKLRNREKFTTKYVYTCTRIRQVRPRWSPCPKVGCNEEKIYSKNSPRHCWFPSFESHQGQLSDIHRVELYGLWCLPITSSAWLELANGQIFANKTYKTSITAKTGKYASKWQCRRYKFW